MDGAIPMNSDDRNAIVLNAVNKASSEWQSAFNAGDAVACASHYEEGAIMHARPIGSFKGAVQIQGFWHKLIEDGFCDVEYIDPKIEVLNDNSAMLSAGWRMNKASGVIHKELWVIQEDGTAKLKEDDFEVQS